MSKHFENYLNISFKLEDVSFTSSELYSKIKELFGDRIYSEIEKTGMEFVIEQDICHLFVLKSDLIHNLFNSTVVNKYLNLCNFKVPITEQIKRRLNFFMDTYNKVYKSSDTMCLIEMEYILNLDKIYYNCLKLLKLNNDNTLEITFLFSDETECENFKNENLELVY